MNNNPVEPVSLEVWMAKAKRLSEAGLLLEKLYREGSISKWHFQRNKKKLGRYYMRLWDYYPNRNPSLTKAYVENFGSEHWELDFPIKIDKKRRG